MGKIPVCRNCQHYYITWDKAFPYGCKAMGFKSYQTPSSAVREASGRHCLAFLPKKVAGKQPLNKKQN